VPPGAAPGDEKHQKEPLRMAPSSPLKAPKNLLRASSAKRRTVHDTVQAQFHPL